MGPDLIEVNSNITVAVVGLGYVGLPLAVTLSRCFHVIGYDRDSIRVNELKRGIDRTDELDERELAELSKVQFTDSEVQLQSADFVIVAVPTPVDSLQKPDLTALKNATMTVGRNMKSGSIVVFESTVYPGATEEVCLPILEEVSGLLLNQDFGLGYSPERVNPGDRTHRIESICKVTSGSSEEVANAVDELYSAVITAGTFKAASIRVAEAAKVIENVQRDVNIALMNEFSLLFHKLGIDTHQVLEAAGTKWNFLQFSPGLVGGHCIGVDPYYLSFKAKQVGHIPELIDAGRRINDGMAGEVVSRITAKLGNTDDDPHGRRALVLGLTFKEDVPDLRNSKSVDIFRLLSEVGFEVDAWDPIADRRMAEELLGQPMREPKRTGEVFDVVVVAVAHEAFRNDWQMIGQLVRPGGILFDVRACLPEALSADRL